MSHTARAAVTLGKVSTQLDILAHTCGLLEQRMSLIEDRDIQMQTALQQLLMVERGILATVRKLPADVQQRRMSALDVDL